MNVGFAVCVVVRKALWWWVAPLTTKRFCFVYGGSVKVENEDAFLGIANAKTSNDSILLSLKRIFEECGVVFVKSCYGE
jgi:hypothetical protein